MKRYIIIIAIVFIQLFNFSFYNGPCEIKGKTYLVKDSLAIDTTYVLDLLKLTHSDSLLFMLSSKDRNSLVDKINRINIKDSLDKTSSLYIRSILSAIYSDSDYSYTGSYLILYANSKRPSKVERISEDSMEIYYGGLASVQPQIFFGDINFDGYKDFFVSFVENTAGYNSIYGYYLFDAKKNIFVEDTTLIDIDPIFFNEKEKTISTGGRIGLMGFEGEDYVWDGNKYVLYAREKTIDDAGVIISTREEIINGEWKVVWSDTTINK